MKRPAAASSQGGRIAILAGGGKVPQRAAEALKAQGENPFLVLLGGHRPAWAEAWEQVSLGWGEVGRLFKTLSAAGCTRICLAGSVVRPDITSIKFDLGGMFALPRILKAGFGGDDRVLRHVISLFEEKGLEVVSVAAVAPDLAVPRGLAVGRAYEGFYEDLRIGAEAFGVFAPLDIGQALVVVRQQIVAVEAAEGTDGLLARVADMRRGGRIKAREGEGLLLKAAKPGQDLRVDLPTVGVETLKAAKRAGLAGLAVEAERVICPEQAELLYLARQEKFSIQSFVLEGQ